MDRRLFFMLNRARAVLYRHADSGVEQAIGVPAAQVSLLFALDKFPQASMQELGEVLGLNSSAMGQPNCGSKTQSKSETKRRFVKRRQRESRQSPGLD